MTTQLIVDPKSCDLTLQAQFVFIRRNSGDLEKALELIEEATRIDPGNAAAWAGAVPIYLWNFDPPRIEEALLASERAVSLNPESPVAWSRRHFALWASGDKDASRDAWDRAVSLDPLHLVNLGNLAMLHIYAGQLDEARPVVEKQLTIAPSNDGAMDLMAEILFLEGDFNGARDWIARRSSNPPRVTDSPLSKNWWTAAIEHQLGDEQAAQLAPERVVPEGLDDALDVARLSAAPGRVGSAKQDSGQPAVKGAARVHEPV